MWICCGCRHAAQDGDRPNHEVTLFSKPWELPADFAFWLDSRHGPWIENIDLDYFYCCTEEEPTQIFSEHLLI